MAITDPSGEGPPSGDGEQAWCALCGDAYLPGVQSCTSCLVPLVDKPPLSVDDVADEDGEQVAYDFDDLDGEARFAVDRVLADAGVIHAWEGTSLVVAPYDSDEVDRLLDAAADEADVDGSDIDDALLADGAEQLAYDLSDWDRDRRAELDGRLEAEGIPHAFDETGDLVILEADEEVVDAIIDAIDFPDQLAADHDAPTDDLATVESLGALFVAADRLTHDASDTEGTVAAVESAKVLASAPVPFGFSPATWEGIVEGAERLRELLVAEGTLVDDGAVVEAATKLRATLRDYV